MPDNLGPRTNVNEALPRRSFLAVTGAAAITVAGAPSALGIGQSQEADIALDRTARHQVWEGFGCSFAGAMQHVGMAPEFIDTRSGLLEALYSRESGIGLDLVRLHIGAFSHSQEPPDNYHRLMSHWEEEGAPFTWANDAGQVWATQEAKRWNPRTKVMSVPWSPPYWMKTNNSARGTVDGVEGYLKDDYYDEFATYIAEYIRNYPIEHGIDIDYFSYINEPYTKSPDSPGSVWTTELYVKLVRTVGRRLREAGFATTLLGPEDIGITRSQPRIDALVDDSEAWSYIDKVSSHCYGDPVDSRGVYLNTHGKDFWQTERTERGATFEPYALDLAERIHWMIQAHDARAYIYWFGVDFPIRNSLEGKVALFGATEQGEYAPNKKYFVMGQFSRFIDPGHVRVAATGSTDDFFVTAFSDPAGRRAVTVLINRGASAATKTISGLQGAYLEQHRTSETEDLVRLADIPVVDGQCTVTLPAGSVVTLVEVESGAAGRPEAVLVSPGSAGPFQRLEIEVEATSDVGIDTVVANVYGNGALVKSTQTAGDGGARTTHTASVQLPDGRYVIRYNAHDVDGLVSTTGELAVSVDTAGPAVTVKEGAQFTVGGPDEYAMVSFKLHDGGKIDGFTLNGEDHDLSDNPWSDINFIKPGTFGAVLGENTLVVYDVAGNTTTRTFTLVEG